MKTNKIYRKIQKEIKKYPIPILMPRKNPEPHRAGKLSLKWIGEKTLFEVKIFSFKIRLVKLIPRQRS